MRLSGSLLLSICLGIHAGTAAAVDQAGELSALQLRRGLATSVALAFEFSAGLRGAQAQLDAAEAEVDQVASQRFPQVQVRGQSRAKDLGGGLAALEGAGKSINVDVVTNLWDWGKLAHALDSQRQWVNAADAQLLQSRQEVAYKVVASQVEWSRQLALVRLGERYRQWMRSRVAMLEEVVAADAGRGLELVQAQARLMQADEAVRSAQLRADDAARALRLLTGTQAAHAYSHDRWPLEPLTAARLLALLPDHPQVRAAQAQGHGERARAQSIRAATLPRLDWEIGKSTYENALGLDQPWHTRLSMSWTPFDGGASRAARSAALSRSLAAEEGALELLEQLTHQIRQAEHTALAAGQRAQFYQGLAEQSGRIRQAFFEQWHHLGQRSLLDVLGADSDHYGHLSAVLGSRFDGYLATVQGLHAAGALLPWLRDGLAPGAGDGRLPHLN